MDKLLFLLSAINATKEDNNLLIYFDEFYADKSMGVLEGDILTLWNNSQLEHLRRNDKNDRVCELCYIEDDTFDSITDKEKEMVNNAIVSLFEKRNDYLTMDLFDLVGLIKQWTTVKVGFEVGETMHSIDKTESWQCLITTEGILNSSIKAY